MERGPGLTPRNYLTLTYRGQKYQQNKEAVSQKHPQLNYRGLKYVK